MTITYSDPADKKAISEYHFFRGRKLMMSESTMNTLIAKLPPGTPVETNKMPQGKIFKREEPWYEVRVTEPLDVPPPVLQGTRSVNHNRYVVQKPWPVDAHLSGGETGLVLSGDGNHYRTAFFEGTFSELPGTFLRGEADTLEEAEEVAWEKFQRYTAGDHEHEFETGGYRNGAGFCITCGMFKSNVFTLQEIGSICEICGDDMYTMIGDRMFCKEHEPTGEEAKRMKEEALAAGHKPSPLEGFFEALEARAAERN